MDSLFALNGEPATLNDFDWRAAIGEVHTSLESSGTQLSPANAKSCLRVATQARVLSWSLPIVEAELFVRRYTAEVPPGFPETQALGLIWRIKAKLALPEIKIGASLQTAPSLPGTPDTGEYLDAITWRDERFQVTLGTEDADALANRAEIGAWFPQRHSKWLEALREGRESASKYPVILGKNGLSVVIPDLEPSEILQIHFVAAWATHDVDKPASWYAADVLAEKILKGLQT